MSNAKNIPDSGDDSARRRNSTQKSNLTSEVNNPCRKEEMVTYKCLDANNYDKDACQLQFLNYKNCKDFWYEVKKDRVRKGIKPYLPVPEERAQIKADYINARRKE